MINKAHLFANLLLVVACCLVSGCAGASNSLADLDSYLADKPNDAKVRLDLAISWLSSSKTTSGSIVKSLGFGRSNLGVIELFESLKRIQEDLKSCGKEGLAILKKADQIANVRAPNPLFRQTTLANVAEIVQHCAFEHAKLCRDNKGYLATFEEKSKRFDGEKLHRVQVAMNEFVKQVLPEAEKFPIATDNEKYKSLLDDEFQRENLYKRIIVSDPNPSLSPSDYETIFAGIKYLAGEVVSRKFLTRSTSDLIIKDVKGSLNSYIIEPCKHFVNTLEDEVFAPATSDAFLLAQFNEFNSNSPDLSEFYLYWGQFKLCNNLIRQDPKPFLKNLINTAAEKNDVRATVTRRVGSSFGMKFQ